MSTAQRHFVNMVRIMLITMLLSTASGHSQQGPNSRRVKPRGDNDAKAECFYATEGITLSGSSSFLIENLCLSSNQKVEGASTPIIAGKNVSTGDLVKCHDWSTRALSARHEVDTIRRNIESGSINK